MISRDYMFLNSVSTVENIKHLLVNVENGVHTSVGEIAYGTIYGV